MTDRLPQLTDACAPCPEYAVCVFCESGREEYAAETISHKFSVSAVVPMVENEECRSGVWEKRLRHMLPGYVFVYSDNEIPISKLGKMPCVLKPLKYGDGDYILKGGDRDFAEWIYSHNGLIGLSVAIKSGSKIKVVDGPLLDYEGSIVEVKRQKRLAKVLITIGDISREVWMSFEWLKESRMEDHSDE